MDGGPRPDGTTESAYYYPREYPTDTGSSPVIARFEDFVGYKNRNEAVWLRGRNHRLAGATLADNAIGATFASEKSFLTNSLVAGETANKGNTYDWQVHNGWVGLDGRSFPRYWDPDSPVRGYEFYDGRVGKPAKPPSSISHPMASAGRAGWACSSMTPSRSIRATSPRRCNS